MIHSAARRFVLLACCILPLQAHASGRRPKNLLPDTVAVNAAVKALSDSLDTGGLNWIWAAPDGTCWVNYQTFRMWYSATRRIEPDGRVTTADVVLSGRAPYVTPLAMLPGGDALMCISERNSESGRYDLARVGEGKVKARGGPSCLRYITVLADERGVVHQFGRRGQSDQAYVRYSVANDTIVELGRTLFRDSVVWTRDSGSRHVRLPGGAPWGLGERTVRLWDGSGLVVGVTTTGWSSETPEVFRFRVPDCSLLARTDFEVTSTAHFKTVGIGFEGFRIVKSGKDYWLFVPSTDSVTVGQRKMACIYSCLLDASLNPVRPATVTDLTARPFAEAPPGSEVEVSLAEGRANFTVRFIAFGPDGRIYYTDMHDTIARHPDTLTEAGSMELVGGGDSIGPVSVWVPSYPRMALEAGIDGQTDVTAYFGSDGEVDSAAVSKSSGCVSIDQDARKATLKARLAGNRKGPLACDITYRFSINPNYFSLTASEVRAVEARLRQK